MSRKFSEEGGCPYGDKCRFAHVSGDDARLVEEKVEKRRAKKRAQEDKYSQDKAAQRALEEEEERRRARGAGDGDSDEEDEVAEEDLSAEESFARWIGRKVRACTLYSLYPDIFEEGVAVIMKWRARYAGRSDIWSRFIKGKAGNTIRIVKEFCESVPVIYSVRRSIATLEAEEAAERQQAGGGPSSESEQPKRVTILDLCSGFGFLSMFLSEMLPAHRVNRIILIDIQWSRTALQQGIALGRDLQEATRQQSVAEGGGAGGGMMSLVK